MNWWAVGLICAVIVFSASMTWWRPWWYRDRGVTKYETWTSPEGVTVKYRVSGDLVTIDSVTGIQHGTQLPAIELNRPFMLMMGGRPFEEMALISATYTEERVSVEGRDTKSLEEGWRVDVPYQ